MRVGKAEASGDVNSVKHLPLTTGTWVFMFSGGNVYVGEGI